MILRTCFLAPIFLLTIIQPVHAQKPTSMIVATGSKTGTYSTMFKNIGKVCVGSAHLLQKGTGGSLDNFDLLLENKVDLAFIQYDVLKAQETVFKDERVKNIRTLLPLYDEEIHLIARADSKKLLKEKATVAAWGGSIITAKIIKAKSKLNFKIVEFKNRESALESLKNKKVDVVLAVVGQPATWIRELQGYQLQPIPYQNWMKVFYNPAKLRYRNLSPSHVPTIAVKSLLVTRNFKTAKRKQPLLKYQKCAQKNLVKLQEYENMHPKWINVDFKDWPWPKYQ